MIGVVLLQADLQHGAGQPLFRPVSRRRLPAAAQRLEQIHIIDILLSYEVHIFHLRLVHVSFGVDHVQIGRHTVAVERIGHRGDLDIGPEQPGCGR